MYVYTNLLLQWSTTDGEPVCCDLGDSFTAVIDPCDDSSEAPQTELDTISDFFDVHGDDQLYVEHSSDEEESCSENEDSAVGMQTDSDTVVEEEPLLYPGCPLTLTSSSLLLMKFK